VEKGTRNLLSKFSRKIIRKSLKSTSSTFQNFLGEKIKIEEESEEESEEERRECKKKRKRKS
jgi:hypothetical protein